MSERPIDHSYLRAIAGAVLERRTAFRFEAHGNSMSPFLWDGDVITVQPLDAVSGQVRAGDIVFCDLGNDRLVVHRVKQVIRSQQDIVFVIQGDAARHPDGKSLSIKYSGKVVQIQRNGKEYRDGISLLQRLAGLLWLWTSPLSQRLYRLAQRAMCKMLARFKWHSRESAVRITHRSHSR